MPDGGLTSALGLRCGEMVAFAGAGGKTTAAWRVLEELADAGGPAVFTTTTQVFLPRGDTIELILDPEPLAEEVLGALAEARRLMWGARMGAAGDVEQAVRSPYPAEPVKLIGPIPSELNRLSSQLPGVTWLVEADGAKGKLLKAPAAHEPVIPAEADRVVVVAGLDAVGRSLDADSVHRPELAAGLLATETGVSITPEMVADLVTDPHGGMKGIPSGAEAVVILTRWSEEAEAVERVAKRILRRGRVTQVVDADLRTADPVVAVWSA